MNPNLPKAMFVISPFLAITAPVQGRVGVVHEEIAPAAVMTAESLIAASSNTTSFPIGQSPDPVSAAPNANTGASDFRPRVSLDTPARPAFSGSSANNSNISLSITSPPDYSFPETAATEFAGDFSRTVLPWAMTISGAATAGQPTSGYRWAPNLTGIASVQTNSSGWNQATGGNDGRTGIASYRTFVMQNGNGDDSAYYGNCRIGGAGKAGATHWLAEPACAILGGDLNTSVAHSYLNEQEFNLWDDGHDVAGVAIVQNFHRTVNAATFGEVWMGDRWQSVGTKAIDVGWSGAGMMNIGLDTVTARANPTWNGGHAVAVNMAADQRIIYNSTATPLNGIAYYGNRLGDAYDVYSSAAKSLQRCNGGSCLGIDEQGNVAIGATSATANLTVNGSVSFYPPIKSVATSYTVGAEAYSIISAAAAVATYTLPGAATSTGRVLYIKQITAFAVTSASANVIPLAGGSAGTAILPGAAGKWCMLQSDGTDWNIMAAN